MRNTKSRLVDDCLALGTLALLALGACSSSRATSAGASTAGHDIVVTRREAQQTSVGPAETFTGTVHVQRLFLPASPSRVQGAYVTFAPGAHTAWHTHPAGQILVVTAGSGYVQPWGGQRQDIHEGDVVWTPPNVKHWHGATPTGAMTHMAIVEQLDGKSAEWMEKVSDAQYNGGP
jgi:quercetin dioxygenase-like cupin family protein